MTQIIHGQLKISLSEGINKGVNSKHKKRCREDIRQELSTAFWRRRS